MCCHEQHVLMWFTRYTYIHGLHGNKYVICICVVCKWIYTWHLSSTCDTCHLNVTPVIYMWHLSFTCDTCHLHVTPVIYMWHLSSKCDTCHLHVTPVIWMWLLSSSNKYVICMICLRIHTSQQCNNFNMFTVTTAINGWCSNKTLTNRQKYWTAWTLFLL